MGNFSHIQSALPLKPRGTLFKRIGIGLGIAIGIAGLWFGLSVATLEALWFGEVGYQSMFWVQRLTQSSLWLLSTVLTLFVIGSNLKIAVQAVHASSRHTHVPRPLPGKRGYWELLKLLASILGFFFVLCAVLVHYVKSGWILWSSTVNTQAQSLTQLSWSSLQSFTFFGLPVSSVGLILALALGLLFLAPMTILSIVTVVIGLEFGVIMARQWAVILAAFRTSAFNQTDPLFHVDIGFYIFQLPVLELLQFIILGISLISFLGVTFYYLISGQSIRNGRFPIFTSAMQRHLYALSAGLMMAIGLSWGLHCFTLLYSVDGAIYGAGFTDRHVHLPVSIGLGLGAIAIAFVCGYRVLNWAHLRRKIRLQNLLGTYLGIAFLLSTVLPAAVQSLIVTPNELARETPYIKASIESTRQAFGLNTIQTETFIPSGTLNREILQKNESTTRNIRLWDRLPLLKANRQLQRIRPYYEFADADIDRYPDPETRNSSNSQSQARQVLISARELDFKDVPQIAKTWINQRLIYTHGYGFTVSPVNTAASNGLPEYFIQDIEAAEYNQELSKEQLKINQNIPTNNPRLYFGELTDHYILTGTKVQELDYPSGNENALTTYQGKGGIPINSVWRRWVFATALKDWQMLLSPNLIPETRVLFHRLIQDRVRIIAPFLQFDQDPYIVTAASENAAGDQENHLYWLIDAYTLSDRYPYSDPGKLPFNYIRNSVKVVVDAYDGAVDFYGIEPDEPILQTWSKLFPGLIQPIDAMPPELRNHLRYPIDLFAAQSQALLTYHMTDPQVFYNREDQWRFPTEIYGNKPSQVKPYYLITKLPEKESEEFVLLIPFTPASRNNLIAWMAARSDGENYGKRLLYQFPKRELVLGPEQVEALINQDPVISQQINLWNRTASRVLQGNLLIIPIERSLLYVEPLYLEAEKTAVPTLARVIVLYKNKIVMAESLDKAFEELFAVQSPERKAIVRNIESQL